MFVLLEHVGAGRTHWDFLLEAPGCELLPTWRLLSDPLTCRGAISAERIADHRPAFLDYEGPLSGDRGRVRRVDRGAAEILRLDDDGLRAALGGELLRGVIEILAGADGWSCRFTPTE